jgi:hypothetical protein
MESRTLLLLTLFWIVCCPALCADAHPADCALPAEVPHSPHEHEHECFCSGDSLPSTAPALPTQNLDQPLVAVVLPGLPAQPELAFTDPEAGDAPLPPRLPGAQPLLI